MGGNTPRGPGLESVTERCSDVDVERKDSVVLLPKKSCPEGAGRWAKLPAGSASS